jgi:hypothetical protein
MRTKPLLGRKAWFGPRRFGWGLSPASPEGWVTTGIAIVAIIVLASTVRHAPWVALVVVVLLLALVFAKGTSPGGPRQWEEFQASKQRGDD